MRSRRHSTCKDTDDAPDPLAARPHDAEAALAGAVAGRRPGPWPVGCCPACGKGRVFDGFLRVVAECAHCHAPLGLARADDAPPYFTILIVGHIVIPAMLIMQKMEDPPTWLLSVIFIPLTVILAIGLIRPIKGATVGLMLTFNMLKTDVETG